MMTWTVEDANSRLLTRASCTAPAPSAARGQTRSSPSVPLKCQDGAVSIHSQLHSRIAGTAKQEFSISARQVQRILCIIYNIYLLHKGLIGVSGDGGAGCRADL